MDILDKLKEYTCVHFAEEEIYMHKIGYSDLEPQEILHRNFIYKLNELAGKSYFEGG